MTKDRTNQVPLIKGFFHKASGTISYVVSDESTKHCAVIDAALDFDYSTGSIFFEHADRIIAYVKKKQLEVTWLIETHVHADHLSAGPYIKNKTGGQLCISEKIVQIQEVFGKIYNAGTEFELDGSQFDKLLDDQDTYMVGRIPAKSILTPGHTPACMTHLIGNAAFVGDTLFMPDGGTARADFPGGSARKLYQSIQKILKLPEETRIFVCHDYMPNNRNPKWETTVGQQKKENIHIGKNTTEKDFVNLREARDTTLAAPQLMIPSIQVNMRAGNLPKEEDNGTTYLKVPVRMSD
jgi:glyoxylase-like metal-dependent hydrolase (beta-lactamase superfamily II)